MEDTIVVRSLNVEVASVDVEDGFVVDHEETVRVLEGGVCVRMELCGAGTSDTTEGVEEEETLKTGALLGHSSDAIQNGVNNLLADGVVTTSVVRGIFTQCGSVDECEECLSDLTFEQR